MDVLNIGTWLNMRCVFVHFKKAAIPAVTEHSSLQSVPLPFLQTQIQVFIFQVRGCGVSDCKLQKRYPAHNLCAGS